MPREKNIGEKDDANQQVLQYGKDLAELYSAEKQKREELEIVNMRLSTIFESSPDGLVVLNKKFIIIQANQAFENLLRMSPKEFLFLNISDALSSNALRDAIRLLEIGEVAKELEISINNPSRTFRVKISPMDKGNQSEWLMLFSDSSGQKILEKQKNDFISIASHELRTPLAQILGFTQVLSKENIDQLDSQ